MVDQLINDDKFGWPPFWILDYGESREVIDKINMHQIWIH